jgi:hypothetical protein
MYSDPNNKIAIAASTLAAKCRIQVSSLMALFSIISASLIFVLLSISLTSPVARGDESDWIRPTGPDQPLIWGRKDGIVFGLPSENGLPGPRGLIRVGVIASTTGQPQLLNFIAIEPVVSGPGSRFSRMAFSELELSTMDKGVRGKRLWVEPGTVDGQASFSGALTTLEAHPKPIERLTVRVEVEKFAANGAHVYVVLSIDSDRPGELRLAVHQYEDSPPVEELTLTATMGNFERLRWLFLKDRVVDSRSLFGIYTGDDFPERENYPLEDMLRIGDGDAIVLCTSDEQSPSSVPTTASKFWYYPLPRLTQYWRVPAHDIEPDLRVRVNGRGTYFGSHAPLPNGVAFENFEVRQRYRPGQMSIFGVTASEPWDFSPPIPHLQRPTSLTGSPWQELGNQKGALRASPTQK